MTHILDGSVKLSLAKKIAKDLTSRVGKSGKAIFFIEYSDAKNSFVVYGYVKNEKGEKVKEAVLIYTHKPTPIFSYNSELITIKKQ